MCADGSEAMKLYVDLRKTTFLGRSISMVIGVALAVAILLGMARCNVRHEIECTKDASGVH